MKKHILVLLSIMIISSAFSVIVFANATETQLNKIKITPQDIDLQQHNRQKNHLKRSRKTFTNAMDDTQITIKVITYNVRCGQCDINGGDHDWSERGAQLALYVKNQAPDFIGAQEVQINNREQLDFIKNALGNDYDMPPVFTGDKTKIPQDLNKANPPQGSGEAQPIYYNTKTWTLLDSGNKEIASPNAPYMSARQLIWGKFQNTTSSALVIYVFNTQAPTNVPGSIAFADLLDDLISQVMGSDKGNVPIIFLGDFNQFIPGGGKDNTFTKELSTKLGLIDADITLKGSFNGFNAATKTTGERDDFIFHTNQFQNAQLPIIDYAALQKDGTPLSDHWPYIAIFTISSS